MASKDSFNYSAKRICKHCGKPFWQHHIQRFCDNSNEQEFEPKRKRNNGDDKAKIEAAIQAFTGRSMKI